MSQVGPFAFGHLRARAAGNTSPTIYYLTPAELMIGLAAAELMMGLPAAELTI